MDGKDFRCGGTKERARDFFVLDTNRHERRGRYVERCFGAMNLQNDMPLLLSLLLLFRCVGAMGRPMRKEKIKPLPPLLRAYAPANRPSVAGLDFFVFCLL